MRGRCEKLEGEDRGLTAGLRRILVNERVVAGGGMCGVAVKCLGVIKNTGCEGSGPN